MMDKTSYYVKLRSDVCFCEKPKVRGESFCRACYFALPQDMRRDLYNLIGAGYEESYDAAVAFLKVK